LTVAPNETLLLEAHGRKKEQNRAGWANRQTDRHKQKTERKRVVDKPKSFKLGTGDGKRGARVQRPPEKGGCERRHKFTKRILVGLQRGSPRGGEVTIVNGDSRRKVQRIKKGLKRKKSSTLSWSGRKKIILFLGPNV